MGESRFTNSLGTHYRLFQHHHPHYAEIQATVAGILDQYSTGNARLLDIGVGHGDTSLAVLKKFPGARIIPVDDDPSMLAMAKAQLPKHVSLVRADALAFVRSLREYTLDGVYSAFTIHNFPREERRALLRDIYRALKCAIFHSSMMSGQSVVEYR